LVVDFLFGGMGPSR